MHIKNYKKYVQIIFISNVRIGKPNVLSGLSNKFLKPQFSQTVGILFYNPTDYEIDFLLKNKGKIKKNSIFSQFSSWLDQYI